MTYYEFINIPKKYNGCYTKDSKKNESDEKDEKRT